MILHVADLRADGGRDPNMPLDRVAQHVAYIAERIGIEHVALGSDFDDALVPLAVGDVGGLPALMQALERHGFDESALRAFAQANWLRVLAETWKES